MSRSLQPVLTAMMAGQQAQKARRLAFQMLALDDRDKLLTYAREIEEYAARLEGGAPATTKAGDNVALFLARRTP